MRNLLTTPSGRVMGLRGAAVVKQSDISKHLADTPAVCCVEVHQPGFERGCCCTSTCSTCISNREDASEGDRSGLGRCGQRCSCCYSPGSCCCSPGRPLKGCSATCNYQQFEHLRCCDQNQQEGRATCPPTGYGPSRTNRWWLNIHTVPGLRGASLQMSL